jgi:serine/threonine-protein kinase RsbT
MSAPTIETESETVCEIAGESSMLAVRAIMRAAAADLGLGLVTQTKVVTAASELARNILRYATEGTMVVDRIQERGRVGLRATFEDRGPGIPDIDLAMQDGFSSGDGLGVGMPGARRLVDGFRVESEPGKGTRVEITVWA